MRELTFVARRQVEWRERPDPRLQSPVDALVRPVVATTCDVDLVILIGRSSVPSASRRSSRRAMR